MGPVWEEALNRYLVDISYPDQTRKRKRFRSQKKAQAFWAREMTAIEEGTWKLSHCQFLCSREPLDVRSGAWIPQFATGLPKLHRVSLLKEDESLSSIFVTHGNEKIEVHVPGGLSGGLKKFPQVSDHFSINDYLPCLEPPFKQATVVQLLVRLAHEAFLPGLEVAIMPPWATGGTIYNFSGLSDADPERVKLALAPADYARLARAKAIYDPQNMFRINFNIAPAP
jgi:hypothetical protein